MSGLRLIVDWDTVSMGYCSNWTRFRIEFFPDDDGRVPGQGLPSGSALRVVEQALSRVNDCSAVLLIVPDHILQGTDGDVLAPSLRAAIMSRGIVPEEVIVASRTQAVGMAYDRWMFQRHKPVWSLLAYLGFSDATLVCRQKRSREGEGRGDVGVLDLLRHVRQACLQLDEDAVLPADAIYSKILTDGARIDTGGLLYSAVSNVVEYRDRVMQLLETFAAQQGGVLDECSLGIFGPGAEILRLYFGESLGLAGNVLSLQNPWEDFLCGCMGSWQHQRLKKKSTAGRRWIRIGDQAALGIFDSLKLRDREKFLSAAIKAYAKSEDGKRFL